MSARILLVALGACVCAVLAACSESVTSSLACPSLCANAGATLRDTVLVGSIVVDTTVTGFPLRDDTSQVSLVARGDTADVRVIVRFDTLPQRFAPTVPQPDSLIARVDSANLIVRLDTSFGRPASPVTIEAYDVDTTAADTITQTLLPLFRQDKLIGTRTFQVSELTDTLWFPLDNAIVLQKLANHQRLRIGLKLGGSRPATLRLRGAFLAPILRFRVSADTSVPPAIVRLRSQTPAGDSSVASGLRMYRLVAKGALPPPPSTILALGGVAGARTYLRFDIPSEMLDSVRVIRASLRLAQLPSRSTAGGQDTLTVLTYAVTAGPVVADPFAASIFLARGLWPVEALRLTPGASGPRALEIVNILSAWRAVGTSGSTRALVLTVMDEGSSPGELNFSSTKGPLESRPTLYLTYAPRGGFGIP